MAAVVAVALAAISAVVLLVGGLPAAAQENGEPWLVYVVSGGGRVNVIDNQTRSVITDIFVGNEPRFIAITPDATTAYVSNAGSNTVSVINTATNTVTATIPVSAFPSEVAISPDGGTVYVAATGGNATSVINTATNTVTATIPVGSSPHGIAVTPDGARVYVANSQADTVSVINAATNTVIATIPVGDLPVGMAVTPDGTAVYVANGTTNTVSVIDTATNTVTATIPLGDAAYVAISPDGTVVYVGSPASQSVAVIDTATNTVIGTIPVGTGMNGLAVTPDGGALYLDTPPNEVTVIDLTTGTVTDTIFVLGGNQFGVAITPDQAPVARFSVAPGVAGEPTSFDASASTVRFGEIATYEWDFGDGTTLTTTTPFATHVYGAPGNYPVTLTETSSGGTSTTVVFTGQTVSRNGGPQAVATEDVAIVAAPLPGLELTKYADPVIVSFAGQEIRYKYVLSNTGNVPLFDPAVNVENFTGTGTLPPFTCFFTVLEVGEQNSCEAVYQVTQEDVDRGVPIVNTARASAGTGTTGTTVVSNESTAVVDIATDTSLALVKSADPPVVTAPGQVVTYRFFVHNRGNQTLRDVSVRENFFSGTGPFPPLICPTSELPPGAQMDCTATYTVTPDDFSRGVIDNQAEATAVGPNGALVPPVSSTATVQALGTPELSLTKTVFPDIVLGPGQPVRYEFVVTNTGTVLVDSLAIVTERFTGSGGEPPVTCPTTVLAPGEQTICTADYVVTPEDFTTSGIENTARATGFAPTTGIPVESGPSTAQIHFVRQPSVELVKSVDPPTVAGAGETVTYTFRIINTGNVPLFEAVIDESVFTGSGPPPVVDCPIGDLFPGEERICTATYTITQADVDAGQVSNTATAVANSPDGPATSPPSTTTVEIPASASLELVKSADPSVVTTAGEEITYSFRVGNNGNTTLTGLAVEETAFNGSGSLSPVTCPVTTLAPSGNTICAASYTVTQADIDAGVPLSNTATATGTTPTGTAVTSGPSTAVVDVVATNGLSLTKLPDPDQVAAAGETVSYEFVVTNNGTTTITGLTVDETAFSGTGPPPVIVCPVTTLAPSGQTTCTGTYTITQADVDAGTPVTNTATASGTGPGGTPVVSDPSSSSVAVTADPSLVLVKSADPTVITAAGDVVTYSFLVANTGNTTVTGLTIAETTFTGTGVPPVVACPVTTLTPGAQTVCTGTYVVTQADIDTGQITDTATADGTDPAGGPVTSDPSTAVVSTTATPDLSLTKLAEPTTITAAGETITYQHIVTNSGGVTLTDLTVTDASFSGTGTPPAVVCPITSLAPGAQTTCTATYTVTQTDIDDGDPIANTAAATATDPGGATITSNQSTATVTVLATPSLVLVKSADPATVTQAGQTITYTFLVRNNGNVTVTNVTINEISFTGTGTPSTVVCPTLGPFETVTCVGTYTVTQADIDAGTPITNTATATALTPQGDPVTSPQSTTAVDVNATAELLLTKIADPAVVASARETVTYSFVVVNRGDVTLTNLTINESAFSGTGAPPVIVCPTLLPGETITCVGTYTVTQADIDAGQITNTATASALDPQGDPVISNPSTATVQADTTPALTLTKLAEPAIVSQTGEQVTFGYVVTNSGGQTVTGLTVSDVSFSGTGTPPTIVCPDTTLEPGEQTTCTGTYTTTQADIDTGGPITNTATATGTDPAGGTVTSAPSSAAVEIASEPSLTMVKSVDPTTVTDAGQNVTYSFLVMNNGNTTVDALTIDETAFSGTGSLPAATCPVTTLAPAADTTCTAIYTVTQADIDAGQVTNTATASATTPGGDTVTSPESSATLNVEVGAQLLLSKIENPSVVSQAGETLTYQYVVNNTGQLTITNLTVTDTAFTGTGTPPTITCPTTTLTPGDQTICTGAYTLTQADLDGGAPIVNTATASGTDSNGRPITSEPSTDTAELALEPSLVVVKSADPTTLTNAGQPITYTFLLANNGNLTLSDVTVDETSFSGAGTPPVIACPPTTASMAPSDETTCTATYTVTQADIDNGTITNTATATGALPLGGTTTSEPSTATVTSGETGAELTVTKLGQVVDVNGDHKTTPGDRIDWTITVTNTGDTTLQNVAVADSLTGPATCPTTTLAPGGSTTCTVPPHVITERDAKRGQVTNTATATATTPTGTTITAQAEATVPIRHLPVTGSDLKKALTTGALLSALGALLLLASVRGVRRRSRRGVPLG